MVLFSNLGDKNRLKSAVAILAKLANYAIFHYSETSLSLTVVGAAGRLMASLSFSSEPGLKIFKRVYPGHNLVDLVRVNNIIRTARDTESIELLIKDRDGEKTLLIVLRRINNRSRRYVLPMNKIVGDHARVVEPQDGLGVGINAEQFVHIFNQLAISEARDVRVPLRISRTEDQLRISARSNAIVLKREDGQYRLKGDGAEETTEDTYGLYHTSPLVDAARLSRMVWIYKTTPDTLLNCELKGENIRVTGNLLFSVKERVIRMIVGRLEDARLVKEVIEPLRLINPQAAVSFSNKGLSILVDIKNVGAGAVLRVDSSLFKPRTFCCTLFGSKVVDLNDIYHQLDTIPARCGFGLIFFGTGWNREPSHVHALGDEFYAGVDSQELRNALTSLGIPRSTDAADALHISISKTQLGLCALSDSELEQLTHSLSPGIESKTVVITNTEGNFFFASNPVGRQYEMAIRLLVNPFLKAIRASTYISIHMSRALGVFVKCEMPKLSIIFPLYPIVLKKLEGHGF